MTHKEKLDSLKKYMKENKISSYLVIPPFFRLLYFLGLEFPPPPFWTPKKKIIIFGLIGFLIPFICGGILSLYIAIFKIYPFDLVKLIYLLGLCLLGGLFFGSYMLFMLKRVYEKLGIKNWDNFPVNNNVE